MVALAVHHDAHELQAARGTLAHLPLVLAGTAGEEDDVHSAHRGGILPDVFLDAIGVHLLGQASTVVTSCDACQDVAEVAAAATHASQTRLLVEQVAQPVGVQSQLVHQEGDCAGVDVTRASAHHQSLERCETHAGVHTATILHGSDAGTISDVAGNDTLALGLHAKKFADTLRDITMAGAVKTIATHAILLIEFIGQRIHICIVGHRLMEGSVEDTHLRDVGQDSLDGIHALDVGRIVQRCQVIACLEGLHHLGRQEHALVEAFAAMYHAMPHGAELMHIPENGILAVGEHVEYPLYASRVLGDGLRHLVLLAVQFHGDKRVGQAYLLDAATGDDTLVVHVVQRILYTAASTI